MRSRLPLVLVLVPVVGCSGSTGDDTSGAGGSAATGDTRAFVPEDLPNTELVGQEGGLTLVAFTLERRERSLEAYAAVENEGATPACNPGMMLDVYGKNADFITTVGGAVESGHFYLIDDGSGVVLSCIPPGELGMGALTGFPPDLALEQVGSLEHQFPAFTVDGIVPLEGVTLGALKVVTTAEGATYEGTLTNGLDVPVTSPEVTIFPVNRVGRPLGVATAEASADVAAHGSWSFTTSAVPDGGTRQAAFAGGSITVVP